MHDRLSDGRKIRLLTIIDTSRASALGIAHGFRSADVISVLRRVTAKRGNWPSARFP
jgi:hypothetical protein